VRRIDRREEVVVVWGVWNMTRRPKRFMQEHRKERGDEMAAMANALIGMEEEALARDAAWHFDAAT
jgi:hypothetical protein